MMNFNRGKIASRFLSTPSGWRATCKLAAFLNKMLEISIHALRVEGDSVNPFWV